MSQECVLTLESGVTIRTDVFPDPVDYVRVVAADGTEIAYWTIDELAEDPAEVVGAIFGAAIGGVRL